MYVWYMYTSEPLQIENNFMIKAGTINRIID